MLSVFLLTCLLKTKLRTGERAKHRTCCNMGAVAGMGYMRNNSRNEATPTPKGVAGKRWNCNASGVVSSLQITRLGSRHVKKGFRHVNKGS